MIHSGILSSNQIAEFHFSIGITRNSTPAPIDLFVFINGDALRHSIHLTNVQVDSSGVNKASNKKNVKIFV